jgi:Leucine-rich repeat (LRR) protein
MKYLFFTLTVLLFIVSCSSDEFNVEINDKWLEKRLIELELDDEVDGVLTITDEIRELEKINLSDENISDAKVIRYFKKLTSLNLSDNNIASIDLSQNKNLTTLDLSENNIASIDLSQNKNLTTLDLSENNIEYIDVSQNNNLTILNLSGNNIEYIDLSKNNNLTKLNLSGNNIEYINLSKNNNLTLLVLASNNLATIDLSQNKNLKTLNLKRNKIENIDLSFNTSLETIELTRNRIKSIDLFNNNKINKIDLSHNELEYFQLENKPELKNLYLNNNKLKTIYLRGCERLENINAQGNRIQNVDINGSYNLKKFNIPYQNAIWHQELTDICYQNNIREKIEDEKGWNWNLILLVLIAFGVWFRRSTHTKEVIKIQEEEPNNQPLTGNEHRAKVPDNAYNSGRFHFESYQDFVENASVDELDFQELLNEYWSPSAQESSDPEDISDKFDRHIKLVWLTGFDKDTKRAIAVRYLWLDMILKSNEFMNQFESVKEGTKMAIEMLVNIENYAGYKKLHAVKLMKENTGLGLKESKDLVDLYKDLETK